MSKVWFITGSSRGLGRELVRAALDSGDAVAATARRPEQLADPRDLLVHCAQEMNHLGSLPALVSRFANE
jgi:NAD(P)-dependent dehydrogenase (short-subunit alcohol dehydrogenase family)